MEKKRVSIILFYDDNGNIVLQDRKEISKHGEEYGFFGGHSEGNETPEETLKREILEELHINVDKLDDLEFFKHFKMLVEELGIEIERDIFIAKIPDLQSLKVDEGGLTLLKFEDSFNFKMVPGDIDILREIYGFLKNK